MVILVEVWIYLSKSTVIKKKEQFSIVQKKKMTDEKTWLRQCIEKFPKGFIKVAGFYYNSKLKV